MNYTLNKKDTGRKTGRYTYTVTDETGAITSQRNSDRDYVACTFDGSFYFGRLDLIGGGDHGKQIKYAQGWGRDAKGKLAPNMQEPNEDRLEKLNRIAYLAPVSQPEPAKPVITVDELAFIAWKNEQAAKYDAWTKASDAGTLKDDDNPAFMFNGISSALLGMIVKGEVSATWLAGKILAGRGQDKDGNWVGFDQADKIHGLK